MQNLFGKKLKGRERIDIVLSINFFFKIYELCAVWSNICPQFFNQFLKDII